MAHYRPSVGPGLLRRDERQHPRAALALSWRQRTAIGIVAGVAIGLMFNLLLVVLSLLVQVGVLHNAMVTFLLQNRAVVRRCHG